VVGDIAAIYGRQAVVAAIDVLLEGPHGARVFVRHGTKVVSDDPAAYARHVASLGAGEILLQAIHRDGTREGFDLPLIRTVTAAVDVPVVAMSGAASRADLARPILEAGAAAVAAGSLFVFQGRSGGVLVNFPPRAQLESLFRERDL
jgi:cyclase